MPHQCTNCGRAFDDGSKEMLSGCPECGGNKFQFSPDGFDDGTVPDDPPEPPDRPSDGVSGTVGNAAATVRDLVSGSAGPDATSARPPDDSDPTESDTPIAPDRGSDAPPLSSDDSSFDDASSDDASSDDASSDDASSDDASSDDASSDDDIIVAESTPLDPADEDSAQADARSGVVERDDLPDSAGFDSAEKSDGTATETTRTSVHAGNPSVSTGETPETEVSPDGTEAFPDGTETTPDSVEPSPDSAEPSPDSAEPSPDSVEASPDSVEADRTDRTATSEPDTEQADQPDLSQLRQELNDQFESIRIVDRGQYELNLMELYDREEVIIALQEDGRYSIRVPEVIGETNL